VGQVEEVNLHFSRVRLITDPNHALPVQISRTGLRAVAFGLGNKVKLSLPHLPREADVREGDLLITSGLGNRFPGGYPVAVIEIVDRSEGRMFAEALARPLAALDRGREVLLLKTPPPQALPPLEEGSLAEDAAIDEPDSSNEVPGDVTGEVPGEEPGEVAGETPAAASEEIPAEDSASNTEINTETGSEPAAPAEEQRP
jgi:rod shape-determining protein MreC